MYFAFSAGKTIEIALTPYVTERKRYSNRFIRGIVTVDESCNVDVKKTEEFGC